MRTPVQIIGLLVASLAANTDDPTAMAERLVAAPDRFEVVSVSVTEDSLAPGERYELVEATGPDLSGRARLRLRVRASDGSPVRETLATARGVVRGPALVARRALRRGSAVSSADLELRECDLTRATGTPLRDPDGLVDRVPLRTLGAGRCLTADLFGPAPVVHRGRPVELRYMTHGLTVVAAGTARADGAPGDLVPALNTSSGTLVTGRVTADGALVISRPNSAWRSQE